MGELEDRINSVLNDPRQMERIMDMARSLMGGETPPASGFEAPDPELTARLGSLLQSGGGERRALLEALRPWLSPRRSEKLERAMRMARVARLASAALGETGGERHV
ncbi:MAG: hypothetical protein IJJ43_03465 [Oscillospiraceae bacterium]|nr:hypothetical protein [Oscillospiraceae bacterium]